VRVKGEAYDALSPTGKEIVDQLKTLTLLEAATLVSAIEEEFGVDASMPAGGAMMMAPMPGAGGDAAPAAAEKTTFDVILEAVDEGKRVAALKIVRGITGLGLKETKDFMAALPKPVKEGAKKEEAEELVKELQGVGATASIK
jgi:large subunit ribosomal protein L7/L12